MGAGWGGGALRGACACCFSPSVLLLYLLSVLLLVLLIVLVVAIIAINIVPMMIVIISLLYVSGCHYCY